MCFIFYLFNFSKLFFKEAVGYLDKKKKQIFFSKKFEKSKLIFCLLGQMPEKTAVARTQGPRGSEDSSAKAIV